MSRRQVCDPALDPDEWTDVDASNDEGAVNAFMQLREYDEAAFDPGSPFDILVRNNAEDEPRKVPVRVVPMHFQIGNRRGAW